MNIKQAIKILKEHNKWRRGDDTIQMHDPKQLGRAIDMVVSLCDKLMQEPSTKMFKKGSNISTQTYHTYQCEDIFKAMRDQLLEDCNEIDGD